MQLDESQLRGVHDGGELCKLPSGIIITRRRKHEPIKIEGLNKEDLERLTSKEKGSKFLPGTTLRQIVEMTARVLQDKGATKDLKTTYNVVHDRPVGISRGKWVRGMCVVLKGRYAHAFPI
jgi:hypothetical protein